MGVEGGPSRPYPPEGLFGRTSDTVVFLSFTCSAEVVETVTVVELRKQIQVAQLLVPSTQNSSLMQ
jgi:hypothetical protein